MTYAVLDPITPLPQDIILQVQQLEPRKQIFDELADLQRTVIVSDCDGVDGKTGLYIFSDWEYTQGSGKVDGNRQTSSSTMEIRARRYSSIVRWNASCSLRLTGTACVVRIRVTLTIEKRKKERKKNLPSRNFPTSSIVRNDADPELLYSSNPPNQAQSSMAETYPHRK